MIFRAIDTNNDWIFGQGLQSYFTENYAIMADIKTTLQSFYQECFFDLDFGVPWFNLLGQKNSALLLLTIKNQILNVAGVTQVFDVSITVNDNRNATIVYLVSTTYSTQVSGEITL
jgi:hypothetical protein